jgi:hypothetical protein
MGVFVTLKNSARNSNVLDSLRRNSFWTLKSAVCSPGPRTVPQAVVESPTVNANIVRAHTRFVQHIMTEVVGAIDHAIFQARLVEGIEKQSEGI